MLSCVKSAENHVKTEAMANFFQNREGSSNSHPTSFAFQGKQKQIGQGQREVFTHFVSLPLAIYPELKENLEAFKNSTLGNNDKDPLEHQNTLAEMGIEESIFISPKTFHLTVVMLKLENNESVEKAKDILKNISPIVRRALEKRPVYIRLKGLKSMSGALDKTRVLYAPVEEVGDEGRLLKACHVIIDAFDNVGFAGKDAKSRLKLHGTVMNANYRHDKSKKMDTFDAREIHKEFGNKDWGTYLIEEAHISQRFVYDPNGYYHCCASLPFPQK